MTLQPRPDPGVVYDRVEGLARSMGIPLFPDLPPSRRVSDRAFWRGDDIDAFLDVGKRAGPRLVCRSRRTFEGADLAAIDGQDETLTDAVRPHLGETYSCSVAWAVDGVVHLFHAEAEWHRQLEEALGDIPLEDGAMSDAEREEQRQLEEEEARREDAMMQAALKVAQAEGFAKVRKGNEELRKRFASKLAPDFTGWAWREFDPLLRSVFDDNVQPKIDADNAVLRDRLLAEGRNKKLTRLTLGLTETEYDRLRVHYPPALPDP